MRLVKYGFLLMLIGLSATLSAAGDAAATAPVVVEKAAKEPVAATTTVPAAEKKLPFMEKYAADRRDKEAKARKEHAGKGAAGLEVEAWRLWLVMAILAAMVGGLIFIMRKYGRGILPSSDASIISIKSKIQLDPRNSVSVLKIYDEEYVVGAGANGVTLLAKLLPIDGVESESGNEAEAGLNEKKIENRFAEEFKLAESKIESQEVK